MKNITIKETFTVNRCSIITDFDLIVLTELYLPLIETYGFSLYLKLLALSERETTQPVFQHQMLVNSLALDIAKINEGRFFLEALGLIKTLYDKKNNLYSYAIFAPKTPHEFFDDILFKAMLKERVGEKEMLRIQHRFALAGARPDSDKLEDISASFGQVHHIDFSKLVFDRGGPGFLLVSRQNGGLNHSFDRDALFSFLEKHGDLRRELFSAATCEKLQTISSLYGIDEEALAGIIIRNFDYGQGESSLDFSLIGEQVREVIAMVANRKATPVSESVMPISRIGSSALAKKIAVLEQCPPAQYLSMLQGGGKPARADLKVIDILATNYGFIPGVINVVIEYTVKATNGGLPLAFAEKIAATLKRVGINDVVLAMNHLRDSSSRKRRQKNNDSAPSEPNTEKEKETTIDPAILEDLFA